MKPSEFFIQSRHLFGFIIPGAVWIGSVGVLAGVDPIGFLEQGVPLVRGVLAIAASYVTGFVVQTIAFMTMKALVKVPAVELQILDSAAAVVEARLREITIGSPIDRNQIPVFCKWYVKEHSQELRSVLAEHEGDINLVVAVPPALLIFIVAAVFRLEGNRANCNWVLISMIVFGITTVLAMIKFTEYRRVEEREACQMFLLLQMRTSPAQSQMPE
jgi:hypothetical protein